MRITTLLSTIGSTAAAVSGHKRIGSDRVFKEQHQNERALSGSWDYDDDTFWTWDDGTSEVDFTNLAIEPKKCMNYKGNHVIAFGLYAAGHNQCQKKQEGTYLMDVGDFSKAYVAQQYTNYYLMGNDFDVPEAIAYAECTAVYYNDVQYYAKLGCSTQGGMKVYGYSDEYCTQEVNTNIGVYNDLKIAFNVCQDCIVYPAENDDDANAGVEVDDAFYSNHMYDSKLCGAAQYYKQDCGWGCKKEVKKGASAEVYNKKQWGGFEKFCLFFWSFVAVALVWVVLKQRRMMSREDAIVEEAAMNGVGLKKRHVFPIALGIIFLILFAMFMVWKKMTWLLLIGTNMGLFAHFVYLRRKAKRAGGGNGGEGYIKDAGLEIS